MKYRKQARPYMILLSLTNLTITLLAVSGASVGGTALTILAFGYLLLSVMEYLFRHLYVKEFSNYVIGHMANIEASTMNHALTAMLIISVIYGVMVVSVLGNSLEVVAIIGFGITIYNRIYIRHEVKNAVA